MADDNEQLWRINVIDEAFANDELTEDELVEALLDALGIDREQETGTELESRLRDFQAKHKSMQSPLIAALLSGTPLLEHFFLWKKDEAVDSEPEDTFFEAAEKNYLTDSYDDHGNMLPPWYVFPDAPLSSMEWTLGRGAAYLTVFAAWFEGLEPEARRQYVENYPVPETFRDMYLFKEFV